MLAGTAFHVWPTPHRHNSGVTEFTYDEEIQRPPFSPASEDIS
jgi:hypothetical protein